MSRVANNPVSIPSGVEVTLSDQAIKVKGPKGELSQDTHPFVEISLQQIGSTLPIYFGDNKFW